MIKKKVVTTLPKKARQQRADYSGKDSENELEEYLFMDDSFDEPPPIRETEPDDLFDANVQANADFVFVKFFIRKGNVSCVGNVAEIGDDNIGVMFLKKKKMQSWSCLILDQASVSKYIIFKPP